MSMAISWSFIVAGVESGGARGGRRLDMNLTTPGKRPVLPRGFLEDNHRVLRVVSRPGKTGNQVLEELLLHLDAAAGGQNDLDKNEVVRSTALNIWIRAIEAEVLGRKFQHTMEPVGFRYADTHQSVVYRLEHRILELGRLGAQDREGDAGHGGIQRGVTGI